MTAAPVQVAHQVIVFGIPRTKKTSNVLAIAGGRHIILPSKKWVEWVKRAVIVGHSDQGDTIAAPVLLEGDYNCRALFYRDADRGDLVGFQQGLADLLEKRQVLVNDKQITGWDGSRLRKDAARPRVELTLEPMEARDARG